MAHTDGKWKVEAVPHLEQGQADVPRFTVKSGKRPIIDGFVILEEDAKLIAATPDLLDVLRTAGDADSSDEDIRTAWWEARAAAIAKAIA